MGYHATIQAALVTLLKAALPATCPVLNALAAEEAELQRFDYFVGVIRERIDLDPHAEINPDTAAHTQLEEWEWSLFVAGGAGEIDGAGKGAEVDLLLETIRTALNARRLTTDCGPMSLISEEYMEPHGNGVVYLQRWRHSRMAG